MPKSQWFELPYVTAPSRPSTARGINELCVQGYFDSWSTQFGCHDKESDCRNHVLIVMSNNHWTGLALLDGGRDVKIKYQSGSADHSNNPVYLQSSD